MEIIDVGFLIFVNFSLIMALILRKRDFYIAAGAACVLYFFHAFIVEERVAWLAMVAAALFILAWNVSAPKTN